MVRISSSSQPNFPSPRSTIGTGLMLDVYITGLSIGWPLQVAVQRIDILTASTYSFPFRNFIRTNERTNKFTNLLNVEKFLAIQLMNLSAHEFFRMFKIQTNQFVH